MSQANPGQPLPTVPVVSSNELQTVKLALAVDETDAGIGVYHLPTNRVHLRPSSQTQPVGHNAVVRDLHLTRSECRGFVIAWDTTSGEFVVENFSGLNSGTGGTTSLQMPQHLFDSIEQALLLSGL